MTSRSSAPTEPNTGGSSSTTCSLGMSPAAPAQMGSGNLMLKTLAAKHRSTVTKMARRYHAVTVTPHGPGPASRPASSGRAGSRRWHGSAVSRSNGRREQSWMTACQPRPPPAQGTGHQAPQRQVRVVPATRPGARAPGPQAGRPRRTGTGSTQMGRPDGAHATQDPHRPACHRQIHDGKPAAICTS